MHICKNSKVMLPLRLTQYVYYGNNGGNALAFKQEQLMHIEDYKASLQLSCAIHNLNLLITQLN